MPDCAVSVVIPTRNRAQILPLALDSLASQSMRDWECWVVDDHSTDETARLLERYHQVDARFQYVRIPPGAGGANAARNLGCKLSVGSYVIFLDSDDALADHCLKTRLAFMEGQPDLGFAVWGTRLFQNQPGDSDVLWNVPNDEPDLHRFLALDVPWQTAGVIWRKSALHQLGPWDETLLSWQDWEYHIRALSIGLPYRKFTEVDSFWRMPRHDSLWAQSYSTRHFTQKIRLFAHVQHLLRKIRTPAIQKRIVGLYFWQARVWRQNSGTAGQAAGLWMKPWLRRLVSTRDHWAGRSLLFKDPAHWPPLLYELAKTWPREYLETGTSGTFQKQRSSLFGHTDDWPPYGQPSGQPNP